jgi:glycerol-3-phosphate dehydrogenase
VPGLPYVWAEVVHAIRDERARDVSDVLCRRIPVFREAPDQGLSVAERTSAILAAELGLGESRRAASLENYRLAVQTSRDWSSEM